MITSTEFVGRWEALHAKDRLPDWELIKLDRAKLGETQCAQTSLSFLLEAGLPRAAAPCLSFDDLAEGLKHIYDVFGAPQDWGEEEREKLSPYRMIGSDGEGIPICINEDGQGDIVLLERDNWFNAAQFVNTSVPQLAESLVVYETYSQKLPMYRSTDDPEQNQVVNDKIKKLFSEIRQIDAQAVQETCYWQQEIQNLYDL